MFDIGFWELVVIGVVALLVVGPDEFPKLVRTATGGIRKARRMMAALKDDVEQEINKVDEVKRLVENEVRLKELHDKLAEVPTNLEQAVSIAAPKNGNVNNDRADTAAATDTDSAKENVAGSNTRSG